jgi:hypothetical protein
LLTDRKKRGKLRSLEARIQMLEEEEVEEAAEVAEARGTTQQLPLKIGVVQKGKITLGNHLEGFQEAEGIEAGVEVGGGVEIRATEAERNHQSRHRSNPKLRPQLWSTQPTLRWRQRKRGLLWPNIHPMRKMRHQSPVLIRQAIHHLVLKTKPKRLPLHQWLLSTNRTEQSAASSPRRVDASWAKNAASPIL